MQINNYQLTMDNINSMRDNSNTNRQHNYIRHGYNISFICPIRRYIICYGQLYYNTITTRYK